MLSPLVTDHSRANLTPWLYPPLIYSPIYITFELIMIFYKLFGFSMFSLKVMVCVFKCEYVFNILEKGLYSIP